ncbi:hypothetical protein HanHA300_Chr08g0278691 [Helianthus annuus]|nr:hypothetical protein HanHA300_Chr08g0278691 [Helianthus annuus]
MESCLEFQKDLEDDIISIGSRIGKVEAEIKWHEDEQRQIEVNLSELGGKYAEYLGDQMLAVVCKHYKDVRLLESYQKNGKLILDFALHMFAREHGQWIDVLCIGEDIRACEVDKDVERKLLFPHPTLPDGSRPAGFWGYAVNIEADHSDTKTDSGCGLRETLLYRLFGDTQVYEIRDDMKREISCIKDGWCSFNGWWDFEWPWSCVTRMLVSA